MDESFEKINAILSSVLHTVDIGIMVLDEEERMLFWNEWMERYLATDISLFKDKFFSEIFPELENSRVHNSIKSAIKLRYPSFMSQSLNQTPFPLFQEKEDELVSENRIHQSIYILPISLDGHRYALIQVSNVTEIVFREKMLREQKMAARQAERQIAIVNKALSESEERYRTLVQTIPDIVYKIDVDGNFVFVNNAISNLGYNPEELIGKHFSIILNPADIERVSRKKVFERLKGQNTGDEYAPKLFDERRTGTRKTSNLEIRLKRKAGSGNETEVVGIHHEIFDIGEVIATGQYDISRRKDQTKLVGTVGIIRNITERKKTEEQLHRAKLEAESLAEEKANFLAVMSHEIRTPMNGVIGMSELLLQTELSREQKEYVDVVFQSGQSLLAILNDILDFSKIEAGRLSLLEESFNLQLCVENILDIHAKAAQEKGLELISHLDSNIPQELIGDEFRIRQVLNNLVSNAVKFTSMGEIYVHVEILPYEERLSHGNKSQILTKFTVHDTGMGVPKNKMNLLFLPFSQIEMRRNREHGGTGLGLSISQLLVEAMQGEIWVDSTENHGSSFYFIIPLQEPKLKTQNQEKDNERKILSRLKGKKIFFLLPNLNLSNSLMDYSLQVGIQASFFQDANDFLNRLQSKDIPDAFVLDAGIIHPDILKIVDHLRKNSPTQHTPILCLLNKGSQYIDLISNNHVCYYVTKPIRKNQLYFELFRALFQEDIGLFYPDKEIVLKPIAENYPLRILLVEDNEVNQRVAERILEKLGYNIWTANNGQAALNMLAEEDFDIIFMDLEMPVMDGFEASRKVREKMDKDKPIIIAMSAHSMDANKELTRDAGMDDYINKPIRFDLLRKKLIYWYSRLYK